MGKLLLAHLQSAPCVVGFEEGNPEDLPIKNTFIHFSKSKNQHQALRRHQTAPSPEASPWATDAKCPPVETEVPPEAPVEQEVPEVPVVQEIKNTFIHFKVPREGNHPALRRHETAPSPEYCRPSAVAVAATPAPAENPKEASDDDVSASSPAAQPPSPAGQSCSDDKSLAAATKAPDVVASPVTEETSKLVPEPDAKIVPDEPATSSWLVDGRRLKGRDTRIASVLRPLLGSGPACAELVVSIFPLPVSAKRGGASFKAANGIGRLQLKCNNPIDMELSVCISIGSGTMRCQKHNFINNPLMTFLGDWDFKTFIDANVDRPQVEVNLQLIPSSDAVDPAACADSMALATAGFMLDPAMADPSIAAFSKSQGQPLLKSESPFQPEKWQLGDIAEGASESSLQTPEVSPRSLQSPWPLQSPMTPQAPPPPSSPFFSFMGSLLFSFTLRLADRVELGLEITRDEMCQELLVQKVIPGGAAEAWNRQCFAGPFSSKAVVPTDRIVGINGRSDCMGMLEECREHKLLKLFVVRGDLPHEEIPMGWCGAPAPAPTQTIQLVPVPVFYAAYPCVKHGDVVVCEAGYITGLDQSTADPQMTVSGALRASAPEYFPPELHQDAEVTDDET